MQMNRSEPPTCPPGPPKVSVGETPLIEVEGIFAKLECTNPCGSVKDRIASYILRKSARQGLLAPGMTIVEATSGNTGIALSYFGRRAGHDVTIVMPENMTEERKQKIRDLGANLILCSAEGSFAEAAEIRDRLALEQGWFSPDQFSNPLNVECHERTTGEEIARGFQARFPDRPIDAFVAGVGTGGTLMGVGQRLKRDNPHLRLVAVEPVESPVLSGGQPGAHGIYGIGDGFIPAIAGDGQGGRHPLIDEVIVVDSDSARQASIFLGRDHFACVGISSGANFLAAQRLALRYRTVVTVFPDSYGRYVSRGLAHCEPGSCPFEHQPVV
ncbi:MAG: cysteine synthase family protein [Deltaproteobacteria bacterium]|nr:cysteine synthase family protein [Deltaproteobacteria bacterium]